MRESPKSAILASAEEAVILAASIVASEATRTLGDFRSRWRMGGDSEWRNAMARAMLRPSKQSSRQLPRSARRRSESGEGCKREKSEPSARYSITKVGGHREYPMSSTTPWWE